MDRRNWAGAEFEQASIGDIRLDRRVIEMVTDLADHPGTPIGEACSTKAKAKAAYDFIRNNFVSAPCLLQGHQLTNLGRLKQEPVILAPADTSGLNYSGLVKTEGLGSVGTKAHPKQRGLWLHSTQAFTPNGLPLGLIAAQVWARPQASTDTRNRHQKPFEEKESVRWRQSWQACQALRSQLPATSLLVNIDDMEGDIYEVFAAVLAVEGPRAEVLIRSRHDRKLEDQQEPLWNYLANRPVVATLKVQVPRKNNQPARIAELQVRFAQVVLCAPRRKAHLPALPVSTVEAREVRPPPGVKPIVWRLVTTLPVTNAPEAVQKVRWYAVRWNIEVYHKILKSVCRVEAHQNEAADHLERLLRLDLLIAWRVHVLVHVGRQCPELPASEYFSEAECRALYAYLHPKNPRLQETPGLGQMMDWIGQAGGFNKCKSNPHPGPITLGRGVGRLSDLAAGWELHESIHDEKRR
jgi:hypothetical protein